MQQPHFDRRRFLATGASFVAGLALAGPASARVRVFGRSRAARRNLVLVQLSGGNDGLSTVVPFGDDGYHRVRESIRLERGNVLPLDDYRGLHGELKGLRRLWDEGALAIVEGCGYPDPVRSHFKALEIWHTARMAGRHSGPGWVGRLGETAWKDDPTIELVVHVGSTTPYSLFSTKRPPVAFTTPTGYRWVGTDDSDVEAYRRAAEPAGAYADHAGGSSKDDLVARLRGVMQDADRSSQAIRRAAAAHVPQVRYPADSFSASLQAVAAMIDADLGTRVYSVELGGFDTHENQANKYAGLMRRFDRALAAFYNDLRGREGCDDTLIVVFSEFGRRVGENGSRGTDHGVAGPMFVLGSQVKGGLYGEHPSLTELDEGDLIHTTDFRSVYATAIERWLGEESASVLGAAYPTLDFV